ncbi:MAG: LexA family protein [Limosilactobacillus pontis]
MLAVQEATDFFPVPPSIQDNNDLFMLKIRGSSMIKAGILNGDDVIVRKQSTARNGDIVIAMNDDNEAPASGFSRRKPASVCNPKTTMDPIFLQNVKILGKVIGLFRDHSLNYQYNRPSAFRN